ncbi:MAG TPA: hypothetical protein VHM25_20125 [Polyangiaceae bacterium]|nr:hypothetical protein [Polyangiaceae bacterium]
MFLPSSNKRGITGRRSLLALTCAGVFAASCDSDVVKPRGQLMLAITTDLAIDKDMNQVHIEVTDQNGLVVDSSDRDIIPTGDDALPGTLALVPPDSGGQVVHVVVSAKQNGKPVPRVVREAIAKVPTDRVAMLRMPLHFLCADLPDSCGENYTCKAGKCVTAEVDSNLLPDYAESAVFGGGDAHGKGSYCLDAQACFAHTEVLTPAMSDCSVPLPKGADATKLNVALVLPPMTDGHCVADDSGTPQAGNCLMPLDSDPDEGFVVSGNRIQLPRAACERPSVMGISVTTTCRTKDLSVPICGKWTGWPEQEKPNSGGGGAAGSDDTSIGGEAPSSNGGTGANGGMSTTGSGDGGAGGEAQASCPVTAALAPAYYYVLVDTSADMQPALTAIRQALLQFTSEAASAGTQFGLQIATAACQGNYSTPVLGFKELPLGNTAIPNFQAGTQPILQLDSAMKQTVGTLQAVPSPASRTLVVFTSAVDKQCGTLVDVMRQALSEAATAGISLRPVLVQGADAPTLQNGLVAQGSPALVQMNAASLQLQTVLSSLNTFRDVLGPCTFIAPDEARYFVTVASGNADQPETETNIPLVASAAACGSALGYYKGDRTLTLCPSACTLKGAAGAVVTDSCVTSPVSGKGTAGASSAAGAPGAGGASGVGGAANAAGAALQNSCPAEPPITGAKCNADGLICDFSGTACSCQKAQWNCQTP